MSIEQMDTIRGMLKTLGGSKDLTVEQRRQAMTNMTTMLPVPENTVITPVKGKVTGEWVTVPESRPERTILYFHGGAYIAGGPSTHRSLVSALCKACNARAFVPEYRLAPENLFPAAVNDAVAAYRWLLSSKEMLEFGDDEANHIVIVGDSAGGGLSISMLVEALDQGLVSPAAAACMSPWADLSCSGVGYKTRTNVDPIIDGNNISDIAKLYLGDTDPKNPLASPVFADLTGLPPLLIQCGSDEVLMGDALLLEERAHSCGVKANLEIWANMVHVWHAFYPMLSEGQEGIDRIGSYLETHWPT